MPSAAARRIYEDQIPTFMSVFDLDIATMTDGDTVTLVDTQLASIESKEPALDNTPLDSTLPIDSNHKHHDSNSSQLSESTDSSPTTTMSTTDSSPLTDASPSTSPDSPRQLVPLNSFPATSFTNDLSSSEILPISEVGEAMQRPMTSPPIRKPRNMKGLSIQPPSAISNPSMGSTEPATPFFIRPIIPTMRRKPSQLSLKTNTSDLMLRPALEVPPSPALPPMLQRRALKHSASSPQMLSTLLATSAATTEGIGLPKMLERNKSGLSEVLRPMKTGTQASFEGTITEEDSPIKTQIAKCATYETYEENVNNEDQKSPSYPDGPVAIYDDNVYLYLEPTAAEAAKFDVVFNVAREVHNPFDVQLDTATNQSTANLSPIPDTALSTTSFMTALEFQPSNDQSLDTPTTPKASHFKVPEYIHVHWDHNTDIAPDLMDLCETIDRRTSEGKRVLIHCQQGASRSASLIIAYGLYKKPELSVNDAYYAAQAKSKWISPNMKLMYSLQDFQKCVAKRRAPSAAAHHPRAGRSPTKHRLTLSADSIDARSKEPRTAPLPSEVPGSKDIASCSTTSSRGDSAHTLRPQDSVSPGPASAPLTRSSWDTLETPVTEPPVLTTAPSALSFLKLDHDAQHPHPVVTNGNDLREPAGAGLQPQLDEPRPRSSMGFNALPLRCFEEQAIPKSQHMISCTQLDQPCAVPVPSYPSVEDLMSPRAETMTANPLWRRQEVAGLRFTETPQTPTAGLFSPRASMFPRESFAIVGRPSPVADPRSPPTKGEIPIIRSIDDVL